MPAAAHGPRIGPVSPVDTRPHAFGTATLPASTRPAGLGGRRPSRWQAWIDRLLRRVERHSPFVRRRTYQRSLDRFERLADALAHGVRRPHEVLHRWLIEPTAPLDGTVCLFAAFQRRDDLSPPVACLLRALVARGVQVVLVVGTDDAARPLVLPPDLGASLAGVLVRANHGGDFGAWSHAHALLRDRLDPRHLLLANDSLVGPLDDEAFERVWQDALNCGADVVGLTESLRPQRHLHSHFLLFGRAAWLGGSLRRFLDQVITFDDKALVVAVYETRLTPRMLLAGLEVKTLFAADPSDDVPVNDAIDRWDALLEAGFPFVKANVVRNDPAAVLAHPVVLRAAPAVRAMLADVASGLA